MSVQYVNIHGQPVRTSINNTPAAPKSRATPPDSFHKGYRVKGIPPGALEEAKRLSDLEAKKPFDPDSWLRKARPRAVRAEPYGLYDAATVCKQLAEKAGWLNVQIFEVKKERAGVQP